MPLVFQPYWYSFLCPGRRPVELARHPFGSQEETTGGSSDVGTSVAFGRACCCRGEISIGRRSGQIGGDWEVNEVEEVKEVKESKKQRRRGIPR